MHKNLERKNAFFKLNLYVDKVQILQLVVQKLPNVKYMYMKIKIHVCVFMI